MEKYNKIQSVYKRDPDNDYKTFLEGEFSEPYFEYLKDNTWVFTEKIDGTNVRIMWDGENVVFGGRTDNAQMPTFLMRRLQELFSGTQGRKKFKDKFGDEGSVCLYGEGCGEKIQKGGGNYTMNEEYGNDFILFDVKVGEYWLRREDVEDIADYFDIRVAPIIGDGTLEEMVETTREGIKSQYGDFQAEGIVARPKVQLFNRMGDRIITKVKCKDFN